MGWRERTWAARDDAEIERAEQVAPEIPLWEQTADQLRIRLHDLVTNCPVQSVQEFAMLAEAANAVQMFHIRGQQLDTTDEREGE